MSMRKKIIIGFGIIISLIMLLAVINWYFLRESVSSTKTRKVQIEKVDKP